MADRTNSASAAAEEQTASSSFSPHLMQSSDKVRFEVSQKVQEQLTMCPSLCCAESDRLPVLQGSRRRKEGRYRNRRSSLFNESGDVRGEQAVTRVQRGKKPIPAQWTQQRMSWRQQSPTWQSYLQAALLSIPNCLSRESLPRSIYS